MDLINLDLDNYYLNNIKQNKITIEDRKNIINGNIITQITGLTNQELGKFIVYLKNSVFYKKLEDNNHNLFINGNKDIVIREIKNIYESYSSEKLQK